MFILRSMAFTIDWILIGVIVSVSSVVIPLVIPDLNESILLRIMVIEGPCLLLFLFRDSIKWLSWGKGFTKIKIVDTNGKKVYNVWKLFLRNLPFIIVPVDVVVYFLTSRSLGDHLTKTNIVRIDAESISKKSFWRL